MLSISLRTPQPGTSISAALVILLRLRCQQARTKEFRLSGCEKSSNDISCCSTLTIMHLRQMHIFRRPLPFHSTAESNNARNQIASPSFSSIPAFYITTGYIQDRRGIKFLPRPEQGQDFYYPVAEEPRTSEDLPGYKSVISGGHFLVPHAERNSEYSQLLCQYKMSHRPCEVINVFEYC